MRRVGVADKAALAAYIDQQSDQQVVFAIGACRCMISTPIVVAHDTFYFHWEEQDGEIQNVIVDTLHRADFSRCAPGDLLGMVEPRRPRPRWICAPEGGRIWPETLPAS